MVLAESSQERLQELAVEPRSTRARIVQALDQEARCVSPPSLVITLRHMRACRCFVGVQQCCHVARLERCTRCSISERHAQHTAEAIRIERPAACQVELFLNEPHPWV